MDALPALTGQDPKGRDWLVEHAGTLQLIEGNWKLIPPSNGQKVQMNTNTETGNDPRRSSTIFRKTSERRIIWRRRIPSG